MPTSKRKAESQRHGENAGHCLIARVPRARRDQTADEAIGALTAHHHDIVEILRISEDSNRLRGTPGIAELFALPRDQHVRQSMRTECPRVHPDECPEKVASPALHHALNALPVVDRSERLLGIVPTGALLCILRREHVEDIHRFAGINRETLRACEAVESPPLRRARHRLPWLIFGLAGSMIATYVVRQFEQALSSKVTIAFFVPGRMCLADAIGTQTETVAVCGLSLSHARHARLAGGKLRPGALIGLVLGAITLPSIWPVFRDFRLAIAWSFALFRAAAVATTIGLMLPWLLGRLGSDPAYGSGPLATIGQDLLSLVIYVAVISAIVL